MAKTKLDNRLYKWNLRGGVHELSTSERVVARVVSEMKYPGIMWRIDLGEAS